MLIAITIAAVVAIVAIAAACIAYQLHIEFKVRRIKHETDLYIQRSKADEARFYKTLEIRKELYRAYIAKLGPMPIAQFRAECDAFTRDILDVEHPIH